ncbi:cell division ATP-binding protein FtsE [Ornithinimicrobium sp. INDO-MA30-4]|uniref:cell division ATP-binding protein FtsE n=1 Tax=Ornithinimicrobium sp. INDO-MA30-4 TaxID=2908651 RepID=UPI001F18614D|nr:cell division ATP-binding protein FtsE [Ornithinimicrobium sp. INDO-MA30-4]UJH70777.1 cell division ATP-binding protein FtsE [Ornithinimicrobium sp. INDO-MA30-4]
MITLENVSVRYAKGDPWALDDVSVDIQRGEFVFVVGASGSGKSSLIRLIILERTVTKGRVLVAGNDLNKMPRRHVPRLRRGVGTVFQDFRLLSGKTVYQNVAYVLQVLGTKPHMIKQLVPETLELVGLEGKGKRLPHELSGGEQQRVAIARAMVNKPPILLADEPTGNLDPETSQEIVAILDRINRSGTTVVMATHDTTIVDTFRKRVVQLSDGVIIRDQADGQYVDTQVGEGS